MKFKIKRILAVMLVFCMMMGVMPMNAFADEPTKYDVWVAGTQVTSANAGNILDGTATYDAATNTLTVNKDIETTGIWGAIDAETEEDFNLIIADGVKLKSENDICISAKNNLNINCGDLDVAYGVKGIISDDGDVTITGKEISVLSNGIAIYGEEITINCDKLSVETEGTTAGLASDGICGEGNVEITCNMLSVVSQSQNGIYSEGSVTIKGSESSEIVIDAKGSSYGCGVWSYQDTTIEGGKLNIIAPQDGIRSYSGVKLTVKECSINTVDCGIDANEDVTINCDKLSVITTEDDASIRAIISNHGDVTITGGENSEVMISSAYMAAIEATEGSVELTAKDISLTSAKDSAIYCSGDVTIDCDTAKITAEENGIETLVGSIIIKDGTFDIRSTETADYETGWYALAFKEDFIYPAGATVTAATEINGTFVPYVEADNATYDHIRISTPTPATYTVTFNSDGGSEVASQTIESGKKATEPTAPTKEGFDFKGWFLGEAEYNFESPVTANVELKAKWEAKQVVPETYTVTFDSNGGSAVADQTIEEGGKVTKPADPTKEGFEFVKWTFEDKEWNFDDVVTGDMTLVAVWKEKEVTPPGGDNEDPNNPGDNEDPTNPSDPTDPEDPNKPSDDKDDVIKPSDKEDKPEADKAPQTGDDSNMFMWFVAMILAGITGLGIFRKRRAE